MIPLFSLDGEVAVVIGGTSGIGHSLALGLANAGADVIASSRRMEEVSKTASMIEEKGRKTLRLASDVLDRHSVDCLLESVLDSFGKVDILINCAGMTSRAPTVDFSELIWNQIMETNLTGTLRGCQIFGKHMLHSGYGRIINIASMATFRGFFEIAAYSASKAAVGSLTQSLAVEWAKQGVTVNAIAPGFFRTDLNAHLLDNTARGNEILVRTPMNRFGELNELVGAAIYLAARSSSFVTGQILAIDGGFLASGVNQ